MSPRSARRLATPTGHALSPDSRSWLRGQSYARTLRTESSSVGPCRPGPGRMICRPRRSRSRATSPARASTRSSRTFRSGPGSTASRRRSPITPPATSSRTTRCGRCTCWTAGEFYFPPDPALYEGLRIQPRVNARARERRARRDLPAGGGARPRRPRLDGVPPLRPPGRVPRLHDRERLRRPLPGRPLPVEPRRPRVRPGARRRRLALRRSSRSSPSRCTSTGSSTATTTSATSSSSEHVPATCSVSASASTASRALPRAGVDGARVRAAARERARAVSSATAGSWAARTSNRDDLAGIAGGELDRYLDVRAETVASLVEEATEIAGGAGKRLVFLELSGAVKGYATGRPTGGPAAAHRLARRGRPRTLREHLPTGRGGRATPPTSTAYGSTSRRTGRDSATCRSRWRCVPHRPTAIRRRTWRRSFGSRASSASRRVDFYHYGFVRLEALDWIRAALEA